MPCKQSEWTTSLVVQWMRIYLPVLGTCVRSLVWEEPTCHEAAKPVGHNCWSPWSRALEPQVLKLVRLEPVHHSEESYLNWRKQAHSRKDPEQPKINTYMIFKKHFLKKESEWDPPWYYSSKASVSLLTSTDSTPNNKVPKRSPYHFSPVSSPSLHEMFPWYL